MLPYPSPKYLFRLPTLLACWMKGKAHGLKSRLALPIIVLWASRRNKWQHEAYENSHFYVDFGHQLRFVCRGSLKEGFAAQIGQKFKGLYRLTALFTDTLPVLSQLHYINPVLWLSHSVLSIFPRPLLSHSSPLYQ